MANNYEILRKAQRVDDLFRGDDDDAAWEHEQAESWLGAGPGRASGAEDPLSA